MKQRASSKRKKEYIVVFYDMKSDKKVGKTKDSELFTLKQANEYIEWAYKYGLYDNAYGLPVKISDYKKQVAYSKQDLINELNAYIEILKADSKRESNSEAKQVLDNVIYSLKDIVRVYEN